MSTDRETTRIVRSWLEEGVTALPDRVLDTVLDQVPATPQRRSWWPSRRSILMNRVFAAAGAVAAVLVVAVVGIQLFGSSGAGAPASTPTSTPAPSVADATPITTPSPSADGSLPMGSHAFWSAARDGGLSTTVTIPARGWYGEPNEGILVKNENSDPPDGAGMIGPYFGPLFVYGDPCHWSTTRPDAPATTVDELVAALSAQVSRDASTPVDITVGGYVGKSITLYVPDDAVFSKCDQVTFGSWAPASAPPADGPYRYHQGPGQIDELWIVDVNGMLVTIDAGYYAGTPLEHVAELRAIVDSMTFELP